jgi:hypothetical protein
MHVKAPDGIVIQSPDGVPIFDIQALYAHLKDHYHLCLLDGQLAVIENPDDADCDNCYEVGDDAVTDILMFIDEDLWDAHRNHWFDDVTKTIHAMAASDPVLLSQDPKRAWRDTLSWDDVLIRVHDDPTYAEVHTDVRPEHRVMRRHTLSTRYGYEMDDLTFMSAQNRVRDVLLEWVDGDEGRLRTLCTTLIAAPLMPWPARVGIPVITGLNDVERHLVTALLRAVFDPNEVLMPLGGLGAMTHRYALVKLTNRRILACDTMGKDEVEPGVTCADVLSAITSPQPAPVTGRSTKTYQNESTHVVLMLDDDEDPLFDATREQAEVLAPRLRHIDLSSGRKDVDALYRLINDHDARTVLLRLAISYGM